MSTADPSGPSNRSPDEARLREVVRRAIERDGHLVVDTECDLGAVYNGRGANSRTVVVLADSNEPGRTSLLLGHIRTIDPACRPVVLHGGDDVGSATIALRHGARPCPGLLVQPAGREDPEQLVQYLSQRMGDALRAPSESAIDDGAASARRALGLAVDGNMVGAIVEIATIEGLDAVMVAVDYLTGISESLLDRIRHRSRYPVPVELVLDRLAVVSGNDVGLCFTMLQRAGLRASGLDLDIDELVLAHGSSGVLFGAFHSANALVRFRGERSWLPPRSVLDQIDPM